MLSEYYECNEIVKRTLLMCKISGKIRLFDFLLIFIAALHLLVITF